MFSSWGIYEGSSNIGCNSRNLQFLFQEVATNITVEVNSYFPTQPFHVATNVSCEKLS